MTTPHTLRFRMNLKQNTGKFVAFNACIKKEDRC